MINNFIEIDSTTLINLDEILYIETSPLNEEEINITMKNGKIFGIVGYYDKLQEIKESILG